MIPEPEAVGGAEEDPAEGPADGGGAAGEVEGLEAVEAGARTSANCLTAFAKSCLSSLCF